MSADDGELPKRRTRMLAPRETKRNSPSSQPAASSSKRNSKRNSPSSQLAASSSKRNSKRNSPSSQLAASSSKRNSKRSSPSSQPAASSSKRSSKKNLSQNSPRDDAKINKEVASTSSTGSPAKGNANDSGRKTHKKVVSISSDKSAQPDSEPLKRTFIPTISSGGFLTRNRNVAYYIASLSQMPTQRTISSQFLHGPLTRSWSDLIPYSPIYGSTVQSPFKRRVTALVCHPVHPYLVVAGSKGGELILYNLNNISNAKFIDGIGAGGSVVALKFHPEKPTSVYTASISGKVRCQDFCGVHDNILLDSLTWSNWFCSLDVLPEKKVLMAGDSLGWLYTVTDNGEKILHRKRVHRSKVTNVELCPKDSNLFVTSSTDHTVKLWDMRMFSNDVRSSSLHTLEHEKAVNSAYFSPSSSSLLTTDQLNELKVYGSPSWDLEVTIYHPHRHFQHMTPIKASWHPIVDAIIVGRYPDKNFCESDLKTIDFYDGHTGKELYRLKSEDISGITSLNCFNCTGDVLASGMGHHIVFWHTKEEEKATFKHGYLGKGRRPSLRADKPDRSKSKKSPNVKVVHKKLKM